MKSGMEFKTAGGHRRGRSLSNGNGLLMNSRPKTLLLVEDDDGLSTTLVAVAEALGYEVRTCDSAKDAIEMAAAFKPTLVFSDVHLQKGDGRTVLTALRADEVLRDCQVVLMTGDWVGASRQESIDAQADDYLAKPFSVEEFIACLNERYRQANL